MRIAIISDIHGNLEALKEVFNDIDKELLNSSDNMELDELTKELKEGRYRDIDTLNKTFVDRGIDKDKI